METKKISLGIETMGFITFIVFLILKLTNTWDISWFWVWFPLWIPTAAILSILIIGFIVSVVFGIIEDRK